MCVYIYMYIYMYIYICICIYIYIACIYIYILDYLMGGVALRFGGRHQILSMMTFSTGMKWQEPKVSDQADHGFAVWPPGLVQSKYHLQYVMERLNHVNH